MAAEEYRSLDPFASPAFKALQDCLVEELVERSIYVLRSHEGKAICPLEIRAGIVEDGWRRSQPVS